MPGLALHLTSHVAPPPLTPRLTPHLTPQRALHLALYLTPHLSVCLSVKEAEPVDLTEQVCRARPVHWTSSLRNLQGVRDVFAACRELPVPWEKGLAAAGKPVVVLSGLGGVWGTEVELCG